MLAPTACGTIEVNNECQAGATVDCSADCPSGQTGISMCSAEGQLGNCACSPVVDDVVDATDDSGASEDAQNQDGGESETSTGPATYGTAVLGQSRFGEGN